MNAQYRIYVDSVIRLVASIVIKDTRSASTQNERLMVLGSPVNLDEPATWRYYRNLQGLYHSTNTPMEITSLDTLEVISFTKENLAIHRTTKRAYVYGNKYYNDLLDKNIHQETLIRGIVNPVSMNAAIDADEYTILSYDKTLVEKHEVYLIPELQKFITAFFDRWYNQDYTRFETNYHKLMLGVLYAQLVQEVLNLRNRSVNTIFVHSYHMKQYLTSFSRVGVEFDYMTHKQRLWLYRNIRYLNRNVGREEIFREVIEKVMTDRGFSLVRHDLRSGHETLLDELKPDIFTERTVLNNIPPAHGGKVSSLKRILDAEMPLARDNILHRDLTEEKLVTGMSNSLYGTLKSKVLESSVLDRQDAEPFTMTSVLLNHWIYLSYKGLYTAVVPFHNPANGDSYRLNVHDAFIFYIYAVNRYHGIELEFVPTVHVSPVRRLVDPTREELMNLVDMDVVPEFFVDWLIEDQAHIGGVGSVITFREKCVEIHHKLNSQRDARLYQQDYILEGYLNTLTNRFIYGVDLQLADNMAYDEWFDSKGIDIFDMSETDFLVMSGEILSTATGAEHNTAKEMRSIHAAMLRMLDELTSYSVHVIREINDSPLKIGEGKFPRITYPSVEQTSEFKATNEAPTILDIPTLEKVTVEQNILVPVCREVSTHSVVEARVDMGLQIEPTGVTEMGLYVNSTTPNFTIVDPEVESLGGLELDAYSGISFPDEIDPSELFEPNGQYLTKPNVDTYLSANEMFFKHLFGV